MKSELEYSAETTKELLLLLLAVVGSMNDEARLGLAAVAHNPNAKVVVAAMLTDIFLAESSCSLKLMLFSDVGEYAPSTARVIEVFVAE